MVMNNNHTMVKEKELEKKKKEEIMNQIGLPGFYTMHHLQNQDRALFGITTSMGSSLIPRSVVTNIIVYPVNTDIRMEAQRRQGFSSSNNYNNTHHDNRRTNTNNVTNSNVELHNAARHGNLNDVQNIVSRNRELLWLPEPNGGSLPLHMAITNGHEEVASFLVGEYPQGSYALNHTNFSPLYLAVNRCHWELAKNMLRLLARDSSAPHALKEGKSIVHAAIKYKNQGMLEKLIKYQPDLFMSTEDGLTPLSYAAHEGYDNIVEYIIRKHPKTVQYKNSDKSLPIHKACLGGHVEVLKKFPVNSLSDTDAEGRTILHLAAKERKNELKHVVSYLLTLNEGRNLIAKRDAYKFTPSKLAIQNNNDEVNRLLTS